MNKTILMKLLLVATLVAGLIVFIAGRGNQSINPSIDSRCVQSATTTPCSALIALMDTPPSQVQKLLTASSTATWKEYINTGAGISYEYPDYDTLYDNGGFAGPGEEGRITGINIRLPSGARIDGYATSRDFATAKDGFLVSTRGYEIRDGRYYAIWVNGMGPAFVPDDIWTSKDGSMIPVVYGKDYDTHLDYPDVAVKAYINLQGPVFTGMGFVLINMDSTGSHPASSEDMATFKRLVTSIQFLK